MTNRPQRAISVFSRAASESSIGFMTCTPKRSSARWTFTNQMIAGTMRTPNGKSQRPVQPLTGASRPACRYIRPISDGMTKALTGKTMIQTMRPRRPPSPSPVWSFILLCVLYAQYQP